MTTATITAERSAELHVDAQESPLASALGIARATQRRLSEADQTLPKELREQWPILSRVEIQDLYPDEWIALLPRHVDDHGQLVTGRLVAHSRDWNEVDVEMKRVRAACPSLAPPFTYFTGAHPYGPCFVRA